MPNRIVEERRARETGTIVQLIDNKDGWFDADDPNRWFTVCVDHGMICSHETRVLARSFLSVPSEWCEDCQAAVGFRDPPADDYVPPED